MKPQTMIIKFFRCQSQYRLPIRRKGLWGGKVNIAGSGRVFDLLNLSDRMRKRGMIKFILSKVINPLAGCVNLKKNQKGFLMT